MLLLAIALIAIVAIAYFFIDPADSPVSLQCAFYRITGYKCPGCGIQRALHAALHGDFQTAIRYNYSLVVTLPVLALYLVVWYKHDSMPRLASYLESLPTMIILLILVLAWWIIRNIVGI